MVAKEAALAAALAVARAQPTGELAHGLAVAGFPLPELYVAYEAAGEFGGLPLYRELGGGGAGIYWQVRRSTASQWNLHPEYTRQRRHR